MTSTNDFNRLTPAAAAALAEVVNDYRSAVLERAADIAQRADTNGDISLADILQGCELVVGKPVQRNWASSGRARLDLLLRFYAGIGVMLAVTGATVAAVLATRDSSPVLRFSILFTLAGIVLTFVPFAYLLATQRKLSARDVRIRTPFLSVEIQSEQDQSGSFIRLWREFELTARARLAEVTGETYASEVPISQVLSDLTDVGFISKADTKRVRDIIQLRNSVVHNGKKVTPTEFADAVALLAIIRSKLPEDSPQ